MQNIIITILFKWFNVLKHVFLQYFSSVFDGDFCKIVHNSKLFDRFIYSLLKDKKILTVFAKDSIIDVWFGIEYAFFFEYSKLIHQHFLRSDIASKGLEFIKWKTIPILIKNRATITWSNKCKFENVWRLLASGQRMLFSLHSFPQIIWF